MMSILSPLYSLLLKVRGALIVMIYRKVLTLSRIRGGSGEVINLLSTDVTRVVDAVVNFHFLWSAFFEVSLIVILAFIELGLSALPCLVFVLLLTPVQIYLGSVTSKLNNQQTSLTTKRVHIMSEILTAIKLIKFYAWEQPFTQRITDIRKQEMQRIKGIMMVKSINFMVVFSVPLIISLTSLGMYVWLGNKLTANISFTVLSVYNTLRYPFFTLPTAVRATSGALIAFKRLETFFMLDDVVEVKRSTTQPLGKESDLAFEIVCFDLHLLDFLIMYI